MIFGLPKTSIGLRFSLWALRSWNLSSSIRVFVLHCPPFYIGFAVPSQSLVFWLVPFKSLGGCLWVDPKDDSTTYQVVPLTTWILTLSCPTKRRKISVKLLAIYLLFDTHHTREVDVCKGLTISLKSRSQRKKVSAVKLKGCLNVHITSWVAWIRYSIVVVVAKLYRSVTLYGSFWRKSNNLLGKSPSPYGLEPELNL